MRSLQVELVHRAALGEPHDAHRAAAEEQRNRARGGDRREARERDRRVVEGPRALAIVCLVPCAHDRARGGAVDHAARPEARARVPGLLRRRRVVEHLCVLEAALRSHVCQAIVREIVAPGADLRDRAAGSGGSQRVDAPGVGVRHDDVEEVVVLNRVERGVARDGGVRLMHHKHEPAGEDHYRAGQGAEEEGAADELRAVVDRRAEEALEEAGEDHPSFYEGVLFVRSIGEMSERRAEGADAVGGGALPYRRQITSNSKMGSGNY